MTERFLEGRRIGLSVSNSINLAQLGLAQEHIEDDVVEITRYLLSSAATLVYAGDLRQGGFTDLLLEVVARHQATNDGSVRFENFLAWPVHAALNFQYLAETVKEFGSLGQLILLNQNGTEMSLEERGSFDQTYVGEEAWGPTLTSMRRMLAKHCDARIVAGGATTIFRGVMPGIAEEALLSIEAGKPTFVLGALGGCALDIGLRCGLASSPLDVSASWAGQEQFDGLATTLNPGLNPDEAAALASPIFGTEMLVLLLKGLHEALREPRPGVGVGLG